MKKKFLAVVVAVLLAVSLVPMAALAADTEPAVGDGNTPQKAVVESPADEKVPDESAEKLKADIIDSDAINIWVAGCEITPEKLSVDSSDSKNIVSGSAEYDPDTNTLTLKDFVYEGAGCEKGMDLFGTSSAVLSLGQKDLVITVEGDCSISILNEKNEAENGNLAGAIVVANSCLLQGEGKLAVSNDSWGNLVNAGVFILGKSEFKGPEIEVNVTAYTSEDGGMYGICLDDDTLFTSGSVKVSVLSPEGSKETETVGITCFDGSIGFNGADVSVNVGGSCQGASAVGIFAKDNIQIAAGTISSYCNQDCVTNGAFSHAPLIASGYGVSVYAGESPDSAEIYGEEDLPVHFADKYVQITESAEVPSHSVTFNVNGGKINGEVPDKYYEGSGLILPTDVTKDGFVFGGWYEEEDFSGEVVIMIDPSETTDKVFYAKWVEKEKSTFKIEYNTGGGKIIGDAPSQYTEGVGAVLPVQVTKEGCTFAGWYSDKDFGGNPVVAVLPTDTGDKTFYAKWDDIPAVTHAVTFYTDGGKIKGDVPEYYIEGVGLVLPTEVEKDGFIFGGWYASEDLSGNPVFFIGPEEKSEKTFYAKWNMVSEIISELTISADYEKLPYFYVGEPIPNLQSYGPDTYDGPVVLSDKNCYVAQGGWMYLTESGEWHSTFLEKANFEEGIEYAYSVVIYPKEGYAFKPDTGIIKLANKEYTENLFDVSVSPEKVSLSYNFGEIRECVIEFDSDGGTEIEEQIVPVGGKIEKPEDPVKEGYTFAGWFSDPECTEEYDFDNMYVADDGILYAKWVKEEAAPVPDDSSQRDDSGMTVMIVVIVACVAAAVVVIILVVRHNKKKKGMN